MKFKSLRILNFRGFEDSGVVELHPHLNVLVGQNSAGKSAFLEAFEVFRTQGVMAPHLNPKQPIPPQASTFSFDLEVTGKEMLQFSRRANTQLQVRMPPTQGNAEQFFKTFQTASLEFRTTYTPRNGAFASFSTRINGDEIPHDPGGTMFVKPNPNDDAFSITAGGSGETLNVPVWQNAAQRIFTFNAERYRVGTCGAGEPRELRPDASNLPVCLSELNRSRESFDRYLDLVRQVLPQIKSVSTAPSRDNTGNVEIIAYNSKDLSPRLGIPLNNCGSGVAQVLAILFVIVSFESAVIIVDEPNSFLHPAATKALMRIMRQRPNLQFVVSTHSAEVIAALSPERVLQITWNDEEARSEVASLDARALTTKRALYANLGISFADVFGNDKIIWVEGATEATCFDLILDADANARPQGLAFIAMPSASKTDKKDKGEVEEFFALHTRVSDGAILWPTSVWFSFDAELRKPDRKVEIEKLSQNRASFLPRRMLENYLLHAEALAQLLTKLDAGVPHEAGQIEAWIEANGKDYRKGLGADYDFNVWCDAAKLLNDMFKALTETRFEYDKVGHGTTLTAWLLENDAAALDELKQYVVELAAKTAPAEQA